MNLILFLIKMNVYSIRSQDFSKKILQALKANADDIIVFKVLSDGSILIEKQAEGGEKN